MDYGPGFEKHCRGGGQEFIFWKGLVGLFKVFQFHPQNSKNLLIVSRRVHDMKRFVFSKDPHTPLLLLGIGRGEPEWE